MAQFNRLRVYDELNLIDHRDYMITHGGNRLNIYSNSGTTGYYGNASENTSVMGKDTNVYYKASNGLNTNVVNASASNGVIVGNMYENTKIMGKETIVEHIGSDGTHTTHLRGSGSDGTELGNVYEPTSITGTEIMEQYAKDAGTLNALSASNSNGVTVGNSDAKSTLNGSKLILDSNMYGTDDPPSDGEVGQIYFKLLE